MRENKEYIGYDYKTITVSKKYESSWVDNYDSFGWELVNSQPAVEKHVWGPLRVMLAPLAILPGGFFKDLVFDHESRSKMDLQLKRDRKIQNKNELNRLQLSMETVMNHIEQAEKTKTLSASVAGYVTGFLGTVCMAIATFGYLVNNIPVCIEFAISGFIGWIFSYVVYSVVMNKKAKKVVVEIENKFDEVNEICKKAYELLS